MTELKPCPFCGSIDIVDLDYNSNTGFYSVICNGCAVEDVRKGYGRHIKHWNTRAPQECPVIEKMNWGEVKEIPTKSNKVVCFEDSFIYDVVTSAYEGFYCRAQNKICSVHVASVEEAKQIALDHANNLLKQLWEIATKK